MCRKLSLQALSAPEAQLLLALEAGGMAAWEKSDADVSVVWLEPGDPGLAEALEPLLRTWLDALGGDGLESGSLGAGASGRPGKTCRKEFRIKGTKGRTRWVEARARRLGDLGQRRWVGIVVDLTERRRAEFPAIFAHELRNPLAALLVSAQLFRRHGRDRPDLLESVPRSIERQAKHLSRLVGDLSDWSRISRGEDELAEEILELGKTISDAVATCRPLLEDQRQELSLRLPATPLHVRSDSARLAEAIGKLLINAAKFTPAGGKIHLAVAADHRRATIRVQDEGIGIDPAALDRVFEPFFRYALPLHPGHTGLCLGLALAKHWVERLGGEIEARSFGKGRGSEFAIRLPLVDGPA